MALPAGITPKTVTFGLGTFTNGDLVEGTVTITAPVNVLHVPTGSPIFSSTMSQKIVNGQATFDLCPTDHPDLNRRDWTYTLVVKINGALKQPDPMPFLLPVAGPDTVDLDSLVSVPSSAGTPVSVTVLTAGDLDPLTAGYLADDASDTTGAVRALVAADTADPASAIGVAQRAAFVPQWEANETVTAGVFRLAPDGTIIQRNANGTTRASYDATEQAAWTGKGGGGGAVASVNGHTGAVVLTPQDLTAVTQAQQWRTTDGLAATLAAVTPPPFAPIVNAGASPVIVQPGETYQPILGLGAAITDSAAYVLWNYLSQSQRTALLTEMFSAAQGNLGTVRIAMGYQSFIAGTAYTYDDMPAGQTDPNLVNFSVARDAAYIIPVLQEILAINPAVRVIAAPWTAPVWMKAAGATLDTGAFNDTYYDAWAQYFVKFIQAYQSYGIPIWAVTPANEPYGASFSMPLSTTEQTTFVGSHLGPAFDAAGITTKILALDDSWSGGAGFANALVADTLAGPYFDGVAWHGYAGVPATQTSAHRAHPDKSQHFTEMRNMLAETYDAAVGIMAGDVVVGSIRNWAQTVTLWNLALDSAGGPNNGTGTGRQGVVTITTDGAGTITRNVSFYALLHIAKFLQPGARRCASTSYAVGKAGVGVQSVAFVNPDQSVVLFCWNNAGSAQTFQVVDGRAGGAFPVTLADNEMSTFVWGTTAQASPAGSAPSSALPAAPVVTATGGAGQVALSWPAPASTWPITGYKVLRGATAGSEKVIAVLPATATSFRDYVAAGSYSYKVTASSRSGSATSTSTAATAAAAAAPGVPVVTATPGNAQVILTWPAVSPNGSDVTSYQVNRSTSTGAETLLATVSKGTTSYTDTAVTNGTTYFYTVTATNSTGTSAASAEKSATPTGASLGTPATASGATVSSGSAWTWNHTVVSGDKVLAVLISSSAPSVATSPVTGVTYGGVAMTKAGSIVSANSGGGRSADIYTLANPTVGTAAVSVTLSTAQPTYSIAGTSVAVRVGTATVSAAQTANGGAVTSLSVNTTSSGGVVLGAAAVRSTTAPTIGGAETQISSVLLGSNMESMHTWQPSGSAVATSVAWTTADNGALVAVPIT